MEKFGKVCKQYIIKELSQYFTSYPDFFFTSFSKTGVSEVEKLRKAFKKDSAVYVVVKNTMLNRSIEESERGFKLEEMKPFISGSCGVLFTRDDSLKAARSLVDFNKNCPNFKIQGGFINGETVSLDTINFLAALPPKEVLLTMVAAGIKAPISGFVALLGNLIRNLVGVIDAISKKKDE